MKRLLTLLFMLALCMFLAPVNASAGEVPLFEYWNPYIGDHFYTININEIGQYPTNGYTFGGTAANVFDAGDGHRPALPLLQLPDRRPLLHDRLERTRLREFRMDLRAGRVLRLSL
jgi:hypothetical protein